MDNQGANDRAVWFKIEPYRVDDIEHSKFLEMLILIEAIPALIEWVIFNGYSFREAWANCPASDWLHYLMNEFASTIGLVKDSQYMMLIHRLKRRSADEFHKTEPLLLGDNAVAARSAYLQHARETIRQILAFNDPAIPGLSAEERVAISKILTKYGINWGAFGASGWLIPFRGHTLIVSSNENRYEFFDSVRPSLVEEIKALENKENKNEHSR